MNYSILHIWTYNPGIEKRKNFVAKRFNNGNLLANDKTSGKSTVYKQFNKLTYSLGLSDFNKRGRSVSYPNGCIYLPAKDHYVNIFKHKGLTLRV